MKKTDNNLRFGIVFYKNLVILLVIELQNMPIKLIESDKNLIKYNQSWIGVPLLLNDGLLMPIPSEWSLDLTIQNFAKDSVISYVKSIALWFNSLEVNSIHWKNTDLGTAQMFMSMLYREGVGQGTIRLRMIHIHEFYKWALTKQYIDKVPYGLKQARMVSFKEINEPNLKLPNNPNRRVKPQTLDDFEKVLAANPRKSLSLSKRDEIIAEIARYMGLRRSEIAKLTKNQFLDLDSNQELLCIEIITAKSRGRVDTVLVPNLLLKKILQYIEIERASIVKKLKKQNKKYKEPESLFLNDRGKNQGLSIDPNYIGDSWKRSAKKAGIDSRFHDNRSSFATNTAKLARQSGENARAIVKDLLRHKTENSASVYVEFEKMQSEVLMRARLVNDAYNKDIENDKQKKA